MTERLVTELGKRYAAGYDEHSYELFDVARDGRPAQNPAYSPGLRFEGERQEVKAAMAISLYDISIANYLQTLGAVGGFLDRGLTYFREHNIDPEQVVETRLYPDMLPFRFQIQSVAHHSVGAIEGVTHGVFRPPSKLPDHDYGALQALIADARQSLEGMVPETINAREGADVIFEFRDSKLPFTAEGFVLSFSLPNFYFHATTAYDILRSKGVPVGKRDFLGKLRMKA